MSMSRLAILHLVVAPACLDEVNEHYTAGVDWETVGRSATIPDDEIGPRIDFAHSNGLLRLEWKPGYAGAIAISGDDSGGTTTICAQLTHRVADIGEQFGHEVIEYSYEPLSTEQCIEVDLDLDARASFDFVFQP